MADTAVSEEAGHKGGQEQPGGRAGGQPAGAIARAVSRLTRRHVAFGLLIAASLALHVGVTTEFHAPAGDGIHYHQLSHELRTHGRYAYGPGSELTYGRMPGWPALLSIIDPGVGNDIETVLVRGTLLNSLFDAVTSVLLYLIVLEAGLGVLAAWIAFGLALFSPLFLLDSCYLLRESLSTMLMTAPIYFEVRALARRESRSLIIASALIGVAMLVRFDAICLGLGCLVPWALLPGWRSRARVAVLSLAACAVTFSPWPIRNAISFGHLYPARELWNDDNGVPLPTGEREWVATWVDGLEQAWLNLRLVRHMPVGDRDLHAHAADSPEERKEVLELFARYNREGLSPSVNQSFHELALRRLWARPFHVLVALPFTRGVLWWWNFPPPTDQPLRSRILYQPQARAVFDRIANASMILGVLGWMLLMLRRNTRSLAVLIALVLVVRTIATSTIAPDGGGQRYLAPNYPLLLLCAATFIALVVRRIRRPWSRSR